VMSDDEYLILHMEELFACPAHQIRIAVYKRVLSQSDGDELMKN
jgi:hypothetical protein